MRTELSPPALDASDQLGLQGALADHLDDFSPRAQQQAMAARIADALDAQQILICEAGTGTGKTLAYLVPALQSGQKVIISTGTRSLQEQLFHRDLPLARQALGIFPSVALLKGRANYLCLQRLHSSVGLAMPADSEAALNRIQEWSGRTERGDIAEVSEVPEHHEVWQYATSTADNCLGQKCPRLADCHVLKARRAAQDAQLLVINHHLFFADLALREEGFGELLPGADAVILDEAHQVPEIAGRFFGTNLSSRQLLDLCRDIQLADRLEAGDVPELAGILSHLEHQVRKLRLALGEGVQKTAWQRIRYRKSVAAAVTELQRQLAALADLLDVMKQRGPELDSCDKRCRDLKQRLDLMLLEEASNQSPSADESEKLLRWFETRGQGFIFHMTPLDIGELFARYVQTGDRAWVFTSATLAVGKRFDHFARQLGLSDWMQGLWESPFDYRRQALCYLPQGLPDPAEPDYVEQVLQTSIPVLKASRGRAFMLFTSFRALHHVAEVLHRHLDYPILVQGSAPRSRLLDQFRARPNAILLGTASFWEGIDVRGEALSCVIIDKLPFAAPDDPVLQARFNLMRSKGGNPFMELQLPQAVIRVKQGSGRLIRDQKDTGVLVLCDPRIRSRAYGKTFINSLPEMPITQSIKDVQQFFAETA